MKCQIILPVFVYGGHDSGLTDFFPLFLERGLSRPPRPGRGLDLRLTTQATVSAKVISVGSFLANGKPERERTFVVILEPVILDSQVFVDGEEDLKNLGWKRLVLP